MLQCNPEVIESPEVVARLLAKAETEWESRRKLYERIRRKESASELVSIDDTTIKVPLEFYIAIMTTGFFAGKAPVYDVKKTVDPTKKNIIKKIFDKVFNNDNTEELKAIIDYICKNNDDRAEFFDLVFDYFCLRGCYETMYENDENEIIYAKQSPLNTIAIYDYSTPVKTIGKLRSWKEMDKKGNGQKIVELETKYGKKYYSPTPEDVKKLKEIENRGEKGKWEDIPFIAIENELGLACFELIISDICAYERGLKNTKNTFQYNDEAKLMVTGYEPENERFVEDEKGEVIENPLRKKEDEAVLKAKVIYFSDKQTGDAKWIEKNVNDSALQNYIKTLIDLIFLITGVPNASDLGFTNADNAKALDRKFFPLEQMVTKADSEFKKQLRRRWTLIINKINKKSHTNYDSRDIGVKLYRNLPTDKNSETDRALKLRGLLCDESVMNMLPDEIDAKAEMRKMETQNKENIENNLKNIKNIEDTKNNPNSETLTDNKNQIDKEQNRTLENRG